MSYNVLLREISAHFAPSKKPKSNPTASQVKIDALKKKIKTYSLSGPQREDLTYRLEHKGKPKPPPPKAATVKKAAAQAKKVITPAKQTTPAISKATELTRRVTAFSKQMLTAGYNATHKQDLLEKIEELQNEVEKLPAEERDTKRVLTRSLAVHQKSVQSWK